MKRTQIYLTDEQWRDLAIRSRQEDTSVAELVRRAVDDVYRASPSQDFVAALEGISGLWADRSDFDSADYVRSLRKQDRVL